MTELQGQSTDKKPDQANVAQSGHERVLSLRETMQWYYCETKRVEQEMATMTADKEKSWKSRVALYGEMIRVVDSFEDVFRMVGQDAKIKKNQKERLAEYFQATYNLLLHILESQGVHQVPLVGKDYAEVEFKGCNIPEPWEVVEIKKDRKTNAKVATEVVRGLWLLEHDKKLSVLRRGQVKY